MTAPDPILSDPERIPPLKVLRCAELMSGCPFEASAEMGEPIEQLREHLRAAHGVTDPSGLLRDVVRRLLAAPD